MSRVGWGGEERNLLPLPGIESLFFGRPARSLVTLTSKLCVEKPRKKLDTTRETGQRNWQLKSFIFWDIMPCSPFKFKRNFGGTCRLTSNGLHGIISQKTALCITPAVRRLNPTQLTAGWIVGYVDTFHQLRVCLESKSSEDWIYYAKWRSSGGPEKNTKNFSQYRRCLNWDSNRMSLEYKSGALLMALTCSLSPELNFGHPEQEQKILSNRTEPYASMCIQTLCLFLDFSILVVPLKSGGAKTVW
jgi:hypothetical protein